MYQHKKEYRACCMLPQNAMFNIDKETRPLKCTETLLDSSFSK